MIFVTSLTDKEVDRVSDIVSNNKRLKYKSFLDIMNSVKDNIKDYIVDIDLDKQNLTKDYNEIKVSNYQSLIDKSDVVIDKRCINIDTGVVLQKHFSKVTNKLITKDEYNSMKFGEKMHYVLETIDFNNPDFSDLDSFYREKVQNFLSLDLMKNVSCANVFKEYEFFDDEYHGIIDLMLVYDDHIDIIDYKLKNIDDDAYVSQLSGYKNYIIKVFDKPVNTYLYSIMNNVVEEVFCM